MHLNWSRGGWKDSPDPLYPRWSLVIEAYFDDSGKQSDSRYVCIAGFLAHISYWSDFVVRWDHLLLKHGIPYLHMKELMTSNGEFESIGIEQRHAIINESIKIIKDTMLIGFGAAVDANYWNTLTRKFQKQYGNAQEFCFERILRLIQNRINRSGNRDYVSVTFDHDMELSKPRLTRYDNILKRDDWARERFVSICFANSKGYKPLQAADILAWETRKRLENLYSGGKPTFGSSNLFSLGALEFADGEYWDKTVFDKCIDVETGSLKDPIEAS
jgi:Protein of unknown function (DUF3800)